MTRRLAPRSWVPETSEARVTAVAERAAALPATAIPAHVDELISANVRIHDHDCVNLNPATNTMSPAASAALAGGLGTRTSLGYPGAKYEMGLEAIEEIEVIAAELAARVFGASFVEFRVPSGAMANLMVFMATARAGDAVIVPPASIAGHVTHHDPGAAGLYGLEIHEAPIDPERYTVDVDALADLAVRVRPRLITIGSSLNLHHHDVAAIRRVADTVGAVVMFDAAHLSGPIAGGVWPNPLAEGAHVMTMSTYKSLAGPTAGLVLTDDAGLAERIDAIAFPGLTANFDAGKTAALAFTLNDWLAHGASYAAEMVASAAALADALVDEGVAVFRPGGVATRSHAFALDVGALGGGMATAHRLRQANLLTSAIGLPSGLDDGVRIGTNELVRWGARAGDMAELASLVARGLRTDALDAVAADASAYRRRFTEVGYTVRSEDREQHG
ncbi:MAG: beta-eliminating lyase-related protein [Actinomycetota bacterium]